MQKIILLFVILSSFFSFSQEELSHKNWQEDLIFLQKKIHTEYSTLFRKITKQDFDIAVQKLYQKIPNMKDHEIKVAIAELVALFGYGHTALNLHGWRNNQIINFQQLPINLYWFSDGIYVQGAHIDYEKTVGAKVLKIGDKPIAEVLEIINPVVSAENDQFYKAFGLHYLGSPKILHAKGIIQDVSFVKMTLEKLGEQFEIEIKPKPTSKFPGNYGLIQSHGDWIDARLVKSTPLWLKNIDKKYFYEYITNSKTVYIRQSSVFDDENETISEFYDRALNFINNNDVERLIIDLRLNAGGNNFNNKDVILGLIKNEKINKKGKLFVVLGRRTFSAAQNLVNEIENYTQATFVGEPTSENVNFLGDARTVILPHSKLPLRLSWAWWQDTHPRDKRKWTRPHIPVELSFQDYVNNNDPVLNIIPLAANLELEISNAFLGNNVEDIVNVILKYSYDSRFDFYNFESKINNFGYQLLNLEKIQDAITIFKLNTRLYPNSANSWDSLAEANWRNGDVNKAKELYNKAIELDPNGRTGDNARTMLGRIENSH
ncbi:tetratricopeptide repeat protein [uncultured Algibacter sp.]|uniref:tetratricopeptide repeat protein n=1 Tax=uncultured Algibacter sp. TaxID=298659 RepID=UPI00262D678A|nr:tetratricopeptide repeat protein [uncultured Algibacter sp.]